MWHFEGKDLFFSYVILLVVNERTVEHDVKIIMMG